jgi:hypothetical protein
MNNDKFTKLLQALSAQPVTNGQAQSAYENLSGFMSLLVTINEREQIISTKRTNRQAQDDNQQG